MGAGPVPPEASLPGLHMLFPMCVHPGSSCVSKLPLFLGATLDSGPLQSAPSSGIFAFKGPSLNTQSEELKFRALTPQLVSPQHPRPTGPSGPAAYLEGTRCGQRQGKPPRAPQPSPWSPPAASKTVRRQVQTCKPPSALSRRLCTTPGGLGLEQMHSELFAQEQNKASPFHGDRFCALQTFWGIRAEDAIKRNYKGQERTQPRGFGG